MVCRLPRRKRIHHSSGIRDMHGVTPAVQVSKLMDSVVSESRACEEGPVVELEEGCIG